MDETAFSDSTSVSPEAAFRQQKGALPDRPCDLCRKRKSRCVKEPGQAKCVLCTFHQRDCTYLDAPARRKRKRVVEPNDSQSVATSGQALDNDHGRSLLDSTLGLHRNTHSRFLGPSSYHEPRLRCQPKAKPSENVDERVRQVDNVTYFVTDLDKQTSFHTEETTDIDQIESIVKPHGPKLVDVYFRIVHPSFPILHKGVFLEKYARSYREFSPPLLAAVYLLAMDWWEYDLSLSRSPKPDGDKLFHLALKTFTSVILRPKLSTVQAGLLLLQRSGGSSWIMTSQIVAVAEELGLHQDCSSWSIPEWERGLRRRLAWAVIMQDIWTATLNGRPSHVSLSTWYCGTLSLSDFPETSADQDNQDGSTEVEKGRRLFIYLTELTLILADVVGLYYSPKHPFVQTLEGILHKAKPMAMRLRDWKACIPPGLHMEDVTARKLCSHGYLHLAYYTAELLLHRCIIRHCSPLSDQDLVTLCREAAKARLEHVVAFVDELRPEHLHAFWWFASLASLVLIGSYNGLLWVTSTSDEEAAFYKTKLEEYRWSLKLRAKGVNFMSLAAEELERTLPDLDNIVRRPVAIANATITAQASLGGPCIITSGSNDLHQTPSHSTFDWNAFDEAFSPFPGASFVSHLANT
jgi:hypothetical protein